VLLGHVRDSSAWTRCHGYAADARERGTNMRDEVIGHANQARYRAHASRVRAGIAGGYLAPGLAASVPPLRRRAGRGRPHRRRGAVALRSTDGRPPGHARVPSSAPRARGEGTCLLAGEQVEVRPTRRRARGSGHDVPSTAADRHCGWRTGRSPTTCAARRRNRGATQRRARLYGRVRVFTPPPCGSPAAGLDARCLTSWARWERSATAGLDRFEGD